MRSILASFSSREAHAKDLSQAYLGFIRGGVLKSMGGGGVSVWVADEIEQARKGLRANRGCSVRWSLVLRSQGGVHGSGKT